MVATSLADQCKCVASRLLTDSWKISAVIGLDPTTPASSSARKMFTFQSNLLPFVTVSNWESVVWAKIVVTFSPPVPQMFLKVPFTSWSISSGGTPGSQWGFQTRRTPSSPETNEIGKIKKIDQKLIFSTFSSFSFFFPPP